MAARPSPKFGSIHVDPTLSPDAYFHVPISPSEPGKFDFYRVHLANHVQRKDSTHTDASDAPSLSSGSSSSNSTRRWTPFADAVAPDMTKSSSFPSNSFVTPISSKDSNSTTEPTGTSSTLTEAVKNAMNRGYFQGNTNATRPQVCGTTISSKDLNHLCPQSA